MANKQVQFQSTHLLNFAFIDGKLTALRCFMFCGFGKPR